MHGKIKHTDSGAGMYVCSLRKTKHGIESASQRWWSPQHSCSSTDVRTLPCQSDYPDDAASSACAVATLLSSDSTPHPPARRRLLPAPLLAGVHLFVCRVSNGKKVKGEARLWCCPGGEAPLAAATGPLEFGRCCYCCLAAVFSQYDHRQQLSGCVLVEAAERSPCCCAIDPASGACSCCTRLLCAQFFWRLATAGDCGTAPLPSASPERWSGTTAYRSAGATKAAAAAESSHSAVASMLPRLRVDTRWGVSLQRIGRQMHQGLRGQAPPRCVVCCGTHIAAGRSWLPHQETISAGNRDVRHHNLMKAGKVVCEVAPLRSASITYTSADMGESVWMHFAAQQCCGRPSRLRGTGCYAMTPGWGDSRVAAAADAELPGAAAPPGEEPAVLCHAYRMPPLHAAVRTYSVTRALHLGLRQQLQAPQTSGGKVPSRSSWSDTWWHCDWWRHNAFLTPAATSTTLASSSSCTFSGTLASGRALPSPSCPNCGAQQRHCLWD
jgi:hypothetical protein